MSKRLHQEIDIDDLRDEVRDEGMTGISTSIMKSIDAAVADSDNNMVTQSLLEMH